LITYQIFAEFQKWWDALEITNEEAISWEQAFLITDNMKYI
jgi:hypothetical protein